VKKKKTPPGRFLIKRLDAIPPDGGLDLTKKLVKNFLAINVKYAGDLKQLAERYGLHYLRSKRMRKAELVQWIADHHPAVRMLEGKYMIGVDWGSREDLSACVVYKMGPEGGLRLVAIKEDKRWTNMIAQQEETRSTTKP